MSDFADILDDVMRIVTFQPREARMRYEPPVAKIARRERREPAPASQRPSDMSASFRPE